MSARRRRKSADVLQPLGRAALARVSKGDRTRLFSLGDRPGGRAHSGASDLRAQRADQCLLRGRGVSHSACGKEGVGGPNW